MTREADIAVELITPVGPVQKDMRPGEQGLRALPRPKPAGMQIQARAFGEQIAGPGPRHAKTHASIAHLDELAWQRSYRSCEAVRVERLPDDDPFAWGHAASPRNRPL